ncbi:5'-deoxynucleotidase [Paenibacillus sp. MMS20-IR301]|uniref:5'-deoxynucleotidase n=1 Tax=Paenibacillus sp. MMS20-IR301 TaxID=2895946 RepID=UPI0028E8078D|nr:5'-deoxynucleotidase [Paenibacillus sp. MMS20-IR301]WNS46362.1 5'-deoxynucleotidase [Paenibacillus sp. MMS20-IR301]
MNYHFSAYLYRLQYIRRWSLMRSTAPENVAQHSFQTALLAHMLCTIGNVHFGRSLNADRAAVVALFHDATEVFTGDIATPVKHNNPRLLSSFREMERVAAERLAAMIPPELGAVYAPLLQPQDSPPGSEDAGLLRYVKAADVLDAYLKCTLETAAGNREFGAAKEQTAAKLKGLALPELEYFLTHMAPGFELSLDELSADE